VFRSKIELRERSEEAKRLPEEKSIEAKPADPASGTKIIFDLLKLPELASLSAAEIGVNPRELMELH
jgi:hypothetical protein